MKIIGLFLALLLTQTTILAQSVSEQDSLALVALYNSTSGSQWFQSDGWLTDPVEDWLGISIENGRVVSINLEAVDMNGPIPTEIADLTELKTLRLPVNLLSGDLPPELASLSALEILNLDSNQLTGTIPPALGDLANLQELNLSTNILSGGIPPSLGNLSNLQILRLSSNQLTGEIPEELTNLSNLSELYLFQNLLQGEIPNALASFMAGLGDNCFVGDNDPNLCILDSPENRDIGVDPICGIPLFSQCPFLEDGIARDSVALVTLFNETNGSNWNRKEGWLQEPLADWQGITIENSRITRIFLGGNQLEGSIPVSLWELNALESLDLNNNRLSGTIPSDVEKLVAIQLLELSNNQLSGSIPAEMGNLFQLSSLSLRDNDLSGPIPDELGNLFDLRKLRLGRNNFTGTFPQALFNLANLEELGLSENNLEGELPEGIDNLTNLKFLAMNTNNLEGPIPVAIGNFTNPSWVDLSFNNFSGEIPEFFFQTARLEYVSLSGNQLTGAIPSIGNLNMLDALRLSDNMLSGPIPDELVNLTNATRIELDNNQLSGTLSLDLATFAASVGMCNFENNDPSLCIPDSSDYQSIGVDPICGLVLDSTCGSTVSTHDEIPLRTALFQNYPNPFNPSTIIQYDLAEPETATIVLTNSLGQELNRLEFGNQNPGRYQHSISFKDLPSGSYYYTLTAGDFVETKRMLYLR